MTELQILTAVLNNNGHIEFTKLLNIGLSEENRDTFADKALINRMIDEETLRGETRAFSTISFGEKGRLRLRELKQLESADQKRDEEFAKEKADQKKQQRFDNKLAILNTVIPVVTFVFGLILGNIDRIIDICVFLWNLIVSLF